MASAIDPASPVWHTRAVVKLTPDAALYQLFVDLFDAHALVRFLRFRVEDGVNLARELPGEAPLSHLANASVDALRRHGLINAKLFEALYAEFPNRAPQIRAVMEALPPERAVSTIPAEANEKRMRIRLTLDTPFESVSESQLTRLIELLKTTVHDPTIELKGTKRGSLIVELDLTDDAAHLLKELHRTGQLTQLLTYRIIQISDGSMSNTVHPTDDADDSDHHMHLPSKHPPEGIMNFGSKLKFILLAAKAEPSVKVALGVGGIATVISLILTGLGLDTQTAIFGFLFMTIAMTMIIVFNALAANRRPDLRPLAAFMAWAFLALSVASSGLIASSFFFDYPKSVPCLFRTEACEPQLRSGPENGAPPVIESRRKDAGEYDRGAVLTSRNDKEPEPKIMQSRDFRQSGFFYFGSNRSALSVRPSYFPDLGARRAPTAEIAIAGLARGLHEYDVLHFSIGASSGNHIVEEVWVELLWYADCSLRDEHTTVQAISEFGSYELHLSPAVRRYELLPLTPFGKSATWTLKGPEYELFRVRLYYRDYTLYVFQVFAKVRRLDEPSGPNVIQSEKLGMISVAHGNSGGCKELSNWLSSDDVQKPADEVYLDDRVSIDTKQLLLASTEDNPTMLQKFRELKLRDRERVLGEMKPRAGGGNPVFSDTYLTFLSEHASQR